VRLYPSAMPSIADLEKLLAADPSDPFVLYGLAQEYAKARDYPKAIDLYDRCLGADPNYCYAYYHKAKAQEAAGDRAGTMKTLQAGLVACRRAGDGHAQSEIAAYLDELTDAG
jgi:tetratricopeptide (TPR) repeat protein